MTYRVPEWEDLFQQSPEAMKRTMESSWDGCMSEDVDTAQEALIHYLACLQHYLRQINPATERAPIERLRTCLVDLLNGQQPSLLKVQRGRGRAPTPPADMEALITASALITFLMGRGQSEEQAARYVTRRLKTHQKSVMESNLSPFKTGTAASRKGSARIGNVFKTGGISC